MAAWGNQHCGKPSRQSIIEAVQRNIVWAVTGTGY